MSDPTKYYKVVALWGKNSRSSATDAGTRFVYTIGEWTDRPNRAINGPMAVFDNLDAAMRFAKSMHGYHEVWECEIETSVDTGMWRASVPSGKMFSSFMSLAWLKDFHPAIGNYTVLADRVKLTSVLENRQEVR